MDATELYKQNAPIEDVIQSCKKGKFPAKELEQVFRELFASDTVSTSYKTKAAKLIFEKQIGEDLQETAMEVLAASYLAPVQQYCWVDYGGTLVRILDPYAIIHAPMIGDTIGLLLWEAEICVLEWLEFHHEELRNMDVLEIGAGVGLAGLAAVERLGARRLTLTDTNAKVLENLKVNAARSPRSEAIQVACLEWYDLESVKSFSSHGFIIAADCLYDPNDVPTFVEVLRILLQQKNRPTALLACSVRNRNTFGKLITELDAIGLSYHKTSVPAENQRYSRRTTHMFTKDWSSSNVEIFLVKANN